MKKLSFLEGSDVKGQMIGSTGEFVFIPPKMQLFKAGVILLEGFNYNEQLFILYTIYRDLNTLNQIIRLAVMMDFRSHLNLHTISVIYIVNKL